MFQYYIVINVILNVLAKIGFFWPYMAIKNSGFTGHWYIHSGQKYLIQYIK